MPTSWDAFISYARADSERTAIAVQRGLERFARPWRQRRAVRIFRDDSAMSTNPALWSAIEEGLAGSGHLVVLLSPGARDSAYVDKEVAWWLAHKGPATILLVLDAGELEWDGTANRFSDESPAPPSLRGAFGEEPRWLDLRWLHDSPEESTDARFTPAMADLSAPIRGVARDDLIGEDLVQHRRVRRLTRAAVALLAGLLLVSIIATVVAVQQRDDVLRQAVTLRSRQLASAASGLQDGDLRLAQLLAVQGFRTEDSAAARQALFQAAFASPLVDRFANFDTDITALATSTDGSTVAVGLSDGRVYTVTGGGDRAAPVFRFTTPAAVTALRASRDGRALLAASGDHLTVWDAAGARALDAGAAPVDTDAIALSPSGRRAAIATVADTADILVLDTATGTRTASRTDPLAPRPDTPVPYPQYTAHLAFLDDHTLRLVGNDDRWLQLDLRTGRTGRVGSAEWAPYANLIATSSRADFLLAAPISDGQQVRAWRLDTAGRNPRPLVAGVQLTDPVGMAISPDGHLVLVNDSAAGLLVAPTSAASSPLVPSTRISGLSGVGAVEFLGSEHAVAAARTELVFLRFGGVGRDATSAPLRPRGIGGVPEYAIDYRSSAISVSPDGSRVAVLETNQGQLEIVPLPGKVGDTLAATSLGDVDQSGALYGPVWLDDGTVLTLSSDPGGPAKGLPSDVRRLNLDLPVVDADDGERQVPLAAHPLDADSVLVATSGGAVQTRSTTTGALLSESVAASPSSHYALGRFSADGRYLALVDTGVEGDAASNVSLRVLAISSGDVVHEQSWPGGTQVAGVEFADTTVLLSHPDGTVDVLPDLGRGTPGLIATTGTRTSTGSAQQNAPVVGTGGLVGLPTRAGLQLADLATLQPSALLSAPPGFESVPRTYAFAPDGHTLVTGWFGADARTARISVRDLAVQTVATQVCARAGGAITTAEWLRVVGDTPPSQPGCG